MNSVEKEHTRQNNEVNTPLSLQLLTVVIAFQRHLQQTLRHQMYTQSCHVHFPREVPAIITEHSNPKQTN